MGVRPRSAISPVTPTIIGSRRPRHQIGLKATARSLPASRKEQRLRRSHVDGTVEPSSWMRTTQSRPLHTCSRRRAGTRAGARVALGSDETRNHGDADREHLLRPEVEVVSGRDVRRCWPTARFVRFLQPEAATRAGGLTARAPRRRERNQGARSRLPDLVPTHDRGPRPLRRRSTWLLLSPRCERPRVRRDHAVRRNQGSERNVQNPRSA